MKMVSHIGSDDGMFARTLWNEQRIAKASHKLLKKLWASHPRIMRIAKRDGRAISPSASWAAWERKCGSKIEFTCYNTPLPKPVVAVAPPVIIDRQPETGMKLVQLVADGFGISYGELIGDCRAQEYVDARGVVVRILRERGWSCPTIGKLLGGRDHSTIVHAKNTYDMRVRRNPNVAALYEQFRPERAV